MRLRSALRSSPVRFLLAGAAAAGLTFILRAALQAAFSFSAAVALAYLAVLPLGYWLNARFVFRTQASPARSPARFLQFTAAVVAGLVTQWAVSVGVMHALSATLPPAPAGHTAHLVGIACSAAVGYLLARRIFGR